MTNRWVAFVEDKDGSDRKWVVFYTPRFIGDTQEEAITKAEEYIKKIASEYEKHWGEEYPDNLTYTLREESD